jgi:hypothetical protein
VEFCEGESFHGTAVYSDTVFVETFILPLGCDSVSTTTVTVLPKKETFLTESIEPGEFVTVGNQAFTQTGMYEVLLQSAAGCDSLVHLDLTVITGSDDGGKRDFTFSVFPNPFLENLTVSLNLPAAAEVSLALFDARGALGDAWLAGVELPDGAHSLSKKFEGLPAGVYWLRMRVGSEFRMVKLVKAGW